MILLFDVMLLLC